MILWIDSFLDLIYTKHKAYLQKCDLGTMGSYKNRSFTRKSLIGLMILFAVPGCAKVNAPPTTEQPELASGIAQNFDSSFITANRQSLLAAEKEDLISLSKQERDWIMNNRLPNLSDADWNKVLDKMSGPEWEKALNKRTVDIMDKGCDWLRYKWVPYQDVNNKVFTFNRPRYPESQTLCITEDFQSIRGPSPTQKCLLRIRPIQREAVSLSCEAGEYGIPRSYVPLTDVGEDEHPPVPKECKFVQKIMLHYPRCARK